MFGKKQNIDDEIKHLKKEINKLEESCAQKGMTFEEMCDVVKSKKEKLYLLNKKKKVEQTPGMTFGKDYENSKLIKFEEFINAVRDNNIIVEGHGYYATENGVSDIEIEPSDIFENIYRTDFTHVLWFDK